MFVKQSEHDKVVASNAELTQQLAEAQQQAAAIEASASEIQTLTSQVTGLTTERDNLRTEVDTLTAQVTEAAGRVTELETTVDNLTAENASLRGLPGAEGAIAKSKTEANHGENLTELEVLNKFCAENAGDINATIAAVRKAKL